MRYAHDSSREVGIDPEVSINITTKPQPHEPILTAFSWCTRPTEELHWPRAAEEGVGAAAARAPIRVRRTWFLVVRGKRHIAHRHGRP